MGSLFSSGEGAMAEEYDARQRRAAMAEEYDARQRRAAMAEEYEARQRRAAMAEEFEARQRRAAMAEEYEATLRRAAMAEEFEARQRRARAAEVEHATSENVNKVEVSKVEVGIWDEIEMLALVESIPKSLAKGFVTLLREGCTLPFIARYRKDKVGYLMPLRLQEIYDSYEGVRQLRNKVTQVMEKLAKENKLTPDIKQSLLNARNTSEVELVYSPLRTQELSLADRARQLGLEPHARSALNGKSLDIHGLCKANVAELSNVEKVDGHITHLLADIICKDPRVMEEIRKLKEKTNFSIQSKVNSPMEKTESTTEQMNKKSDPDTYKLYFKWTCPVALIKPHQTLALNRGEDEKILTINVIVPDWFYIQLEKFCSRIWPNGTYYVKKGLKYAHNHSIKRWLTKNVRRELTDIAQKEAIKTFISNLEKFLLTEPIKNRCILGLDPGFRSGCKVGIIDCNGKYLKVHTLYPHMKHKGKDNQEAAKLIKLIRAYNVELIGLGNGTACRETESWLKHHNISTQVPVVIVPEQGASVYSVSKDAQEEHSNMDPNLISALSIARRVLDPLGELIKVDPKNLGVGLYQHDIPPKMLESALGCAVEKVVSLVGADINTASLALLRRIAGLNEISAKNLIIYRQKNGGFRSREEIMKVSGIGKITYQQCAGFLKVMDGTEPLDTTIIHPESYDLAKVIALNLGLNTRDLLKPHFAQCVEAKERTMHKVAMTQVLNTDSSTLDLILTAFKQKPNADDLLAFSKPVYSVSVQAMEQLKEGDTITGVVRNVVPFGCFVDCGVDDDGLIHTSNMGGNGTPQLGDRVLVTVISTPKAKKLQLRLVTILSLI